MSRVAARAGRSCPAASVCRSHEAVEEGHDGDRGEVGGDDGEHHRHGQAADEVARAFRA